MRLPIVNVDSSEVWPPLVNSFLNEQARRVQGVGGGVMTAPLPIIGNSVNAWGDALNAYLSELDTRLTAVEGVPGGTTVGSGYGVGPFGSVPWDTTTAPAAAYTVLSQGVIIPNIATIGWGKEINETFFTPLNGMMDRLTALGV